MIQVYVVTGKPVSSETLARRFRLSLSPASIRHVLGDLEAMGLLTQRHTSGGRIPTDRGYRYFVDSLMEQERLTPDEIGGITRVCADPATPVDRLMEATCRLLSDVTHQVGVILFPGILDNEFAQVDFVRLPGARLLVVLLTTDGDLRTTAVDQPEEITGERLSRLARVLNHELAGVRVGQIVEVLEGRVLGTMGADADLLQRACGMFRAVMGRQGRARFHVDGASHLFEAPEFQSPARLRRLLQAFEDREELVAIMSQDLATEGIRIHIGGEHEYAPIRDCSLVLATYRVGRRALGSLGVIGPTRMEYARTASLVAETARSLNAALSRFGGTGGPLW